MTILEAMTNVDPQVRADVEAVLRQLFDGIPLDPAAACRVEDRARRITEGIRRVHGETIDVDELLREVRDES